MRYKLETVPRQSFRVRLYNKIASHLERMAFILRKKALDGFEDFEFKEPSNLWEEERGKLPTVEELEEAYTLRLKTINKQ